MRIFSLTILGLLLLVGCARAQTQSGAATASIVGRVFSGGAQVKISALDDDGTVLDTFCETTADATGGFVCAADPDGYDSFGPIVITASDSSGDVLRSLVADCPLDGSFRIAVSRFSDIGTARALDLVAKLVSLEGAIAAADAEVRAAAGLGADSIFKVAEAAEAARRRTLGERFRTVASPDLHRSLVADFAAHRAFTGSNAAVWTSLGGTNPAPAAVPIGFSVTGPVISISGEFWVTWSSALSATYRVTLCQTASITAPDCRAFDTANLGVKIEAGLLEPGVYHVWVRDSAGRDASNSTPSLPYSFKLVSQ